MSGPKWPRNGYQQRGVNTEAYQRNVDVSTPPYRHPTGRRGRSWEWSLPCSGMKKARKKM